MSLPPRGAAIYALLAKEEAGAYPRGVEARDSETVIDDLQITTPLGQTISKEKQRDFYSYRQWYQGYPNEFVVKVHEYISFGGASNDILIGRDSSSDFVFKCPTDWEVLYIPGPPYYQPVPDPNGKIFEYEYTKGSYPYATFIVPRWKDDPAMDFSEDGQSYNFFSTRAIVPIKNKKYLIFQGTDEINDFTGSWDVKVDNLLSEVLNGTTGEYEYYPFLQLTSELKVTAKYLIPKFWETCCWNKGTVIRGKVSIYSADVTTGTLPESGYGFYGMSAKVGSTFSPQTEVEWEVTINDDYEPVEVEIPKVSGKVTFINDFWIEEIVPPGGA